MPYMACTLCQAHDSAICIRSCFTIWPNANRLFSPLFGMEVNTEQMFDASLLFIHTVWLRATKFSMMSHYRERMFLYVIELRRSLGLHCPLGQFVDCLQLARLWFIFTKFCKLSCHRRVDHCPVIRKLKVLLCGLGSPLVVVYYCEGVWFAKV